MGRVDDIAGRFSLAGVLDENTRARERFPISELEVASIADHPGNDAYSMDGAGIRALADSIKKDGLTDIPLVRRLGDGSLQMISGHRRKAAYALLAAEDPAFAKMPCRIVEGIDDERAGTLLHTANYFTRELTVMERARATRALGLEVKRMREADPALKGARSSDLKAAIIKAQTGRDVAPRTIERHEKVARTVERKLEPEWQRRAEAGELTDKDVERLAKLGRDAQRELADEVADGESPSAAIKAAADGAQKGAKTCRSRRSRTTAPLWRSDPSELLFAALESLRAARAAVVAGAAGADLTAQLEAIEAEVAAIRAVS